MSITQIRGNQIRTQSIPRSAVDASFESDVASVESDVSTILSTMSTDVERLAAITQLTTDYANADSSVTTALEAQVTTNRSGAGLNTDGSFKTRTTSNYLNSAVSLDSSLTALDVQLETVTSDLATETSARGTAVSGVQSELDATQSGAGLGSGGAYTAPVGTNYLGSATDLNDATDLLDAQIKVNADAIAGGSGVQSELDATQTGAGLNANGTYSAQSGTNYLGSATSLANESALLDTQAKTNADAASAVQTQMTSHLADTNYLHSDDFIYGETPTGTVDGTNKDFVLAHTPRSGKLDVNKNGIGSYVGEDYTLVGATITFTNAPTSTGTVDKIRANYIWNSQA